MPLLSHFLLPLSLHSSNSRNDVILHALMDSGTLSVDEN